LWRIRFRPRAPVNKAFKKIYLKAFYFEAHDLSVSGLNRLSGVVNGRFAAWVGKIYFLGRRYGYVIQYGRIK
jgi:hypothetical protein